MSNRSRTTGIGFGTDLPNQHELVLREITTRLNLPRIESDADIVLERIRDARNLLHGDKTILGEIFNTFTLSQTSVALAEVIEKFKVDDASLKELFQTASESGHLDFFTDDLASILPDCTHPTEAIDEELKKISDELFSLMNTCFTASEFRFVQIHPIGSCVTGFSLGEISDFDVCVEISNSDASKDLELRALMTLVEAAKAWCNFQFNDFVEAARVPVLKLTHRTSRIEVLLHTDSKKS